MLIVEFKNSRISTKQRSDSGKRLTWKNQTLEVMAAGCGLLLLVYV